jgi:RNA recognition motif-containing protein
VRILTVYLFFTFARWGGVSKPWEDKQNKEILVNIYVGNLSRGIGEEELRQQFEAFGQVAKVSLITDRDTGSPRGFAFVEMANDSEGEAAIAALNGKELDGRALNVSQARPRGERTGGGGGGGGRRFGGGGGGRGGRDRGDRGGFNNQKRW